MLRDPQRCARRRGDRLRESGGVNVGARFLQQKFDQAGRPCYKRAAGPEGFAQSAHEDRHVVLAQAEMLQGAPARSPDNSEAVRVIHDEPRAVSSRTGGECGEWRKVAVHAEHAIGRDDRGVRR